MKTFWLKIAGFALVVVVAIVLIGNFTSRNSESSPQPPETPKAQPQAKQRTFYDQVEKDKKKFLAEPQSAKKSEQDKQQQQQKPAEENWIPAETAKTTVLYFKPLDEIEKTEAERLLNVAVPGRSIGRLPVTGFKLMVDACRQIISKWPDSWYAYRAKRMLADMPERFRPRYKITAQELDVSKFAKQRPGTEPFTVEDYPSK